MNEITGDLFKQPHVNAICITTNAFIKKDGTLVMGRGCARVCRDKFPGIDMKLGALIQTGGNHVYHIHTTTTQLIDESAGWETQDIYSFPVKKYWWDQADLSLIEQSAKELITITDQKKYTSVVLPRPGCGFGKRDWETEVKPILSKLLDNRFYVITFEE